VEGMVKKDLVAIQTLLDKNYDEAYALLQKEADNDSLMAHFFLSFLYGQEELKYYDPSQSFEELYLCLTHRDFEFYFDQRKQDLGMETIVLMYQHMDKLQRDLLKRLKEQNAFAVGSNLSEEAKKYLLMLVIMYQNKQSYYKDVNEKGIQALASVFSLLLEVDYKEVYYYYARSLDEGIGLEVDYQKAVEYYEEAAKNKVNIAFYRLGKMFEQEKYVTRDLEAEDFYLEEAAYNNVLIACKEMMKKIVVEYDYEERFSIFIDLLKNAINAYDQEALLYYEHIEEMIHAKINGLGFCPRSSYYFTEFLGKIIQDSFGRTYYISWRLSSAPYLETPEDTLLNLLKEAALQYENKRALYYLGRHYFDRKTEEGYKQAVSCFKKAADQDHLPGVQMMIHCSSKGLGMEVSIDEMLHWASVYERLTDQQEDTEEY
jgi:TPR repeat protein